MVLRYCMTVVGVSFCLMVHVNLTCLFVFPGFFFMLLEIEGSKGRPQSCYSETRLGFFSSRGDKM